MSKRSRTESDIIQALFDGAHFEGDCLISHLRPNAKGYISVQPNGRSGKKWRAHRLVFYHCVEPITEFDLILHSCDKRACINPAHLRKGTAQDNTNDMMSRARGANQYRSGYNRKYGNVQ